MVAVPSSPAVIVQVLMDHGAGHLKDCAQCLRCIVLIHPDDG